MLRTDAGHSLLARYRRTQNTRDLNQSIKHFACASDLCPMDHPYHPAALFNLATAKFVSCRANETHPDLDIAITLFQNALDLRPTGHPDRPITQLHLAIALLSCFAERGFQTDADEAEESLNDILDVCHANSHIHRAALLAIETSALHPAGSIDANDRCLLGDDPRALNEVISFHYDALGYHNTMHARRGQFLRNPGVMPVTRPERRGNDGDFDQAITLQREALALRPVGHTDRSSSLFNLAAQLSTSFDHQGDDEYPDDAIALNREAVTMAYHTWSHVTQTSPSPSWIVGL
ncbi:hypothetical protein EDB19DRAFT_1630783 [Suillus lakei]|nr:hypothetical protein EDB19DRAFT_1630783 [Suillus lakei]